MGHAEHVREVLAVQHVAQVELDDLPVSRVQAGQGRHHERVQLFAFGPGGGIRWAGNHLARLVQRSGQPLCPEPAETFVTGHGVQPWAEALRLTQPAPFRGGDDEGVRDGVGGIGRLGKE